MDQNCNQQCGQCDQECQGRDEKQIIKEVMDKIKYKIMVMSNKGGVGKSTVAANLADELSNQENKVGLLDIDIHGPSQAKIFNISERLEVDDAGKITPFKPRENLKLISVAGILASDDQPVVWRGPIKMGIIKQFITDVDWGELDYLIIDAPPGTGDESLTIAQLLPSLNGVIIVTTPQDLAVLDCKKAINFVQQLNTKIIGFIENMTVLQCPHCQQNINLFASKQEKQLEAELQIDLLGKLPFERRLLQSMDAGDSFVGNYAETITAKVFKEVVEKVKYKLT